MRWADTTTLLFFLAAVVLGGSNFVAVHFSNRELDPFWGAGLRFVLAGLVFVALAFALRVVPRGRALAGAVAFGLLNYGASYALLCVGLLQAPAALAAAVVSLVPLLTFVLAVAGRLESLRWSGVAGGAVAVAGTGLLFADQLRGSVGPGALLALLGGAFCIAAATVVAKVLPRAHPIGTNAAGALPGGALLIALSIASGERIAAPMAPETWIALAYLALPGTVVLFAAVLLVVMRWTASATSYVTVLFPLVAVPVGAVLAGELVSAQFLTGAALVMAGAYIGVSGGRIRRPVLR
ncbi:MAG: EamA family transporter [Alphaproteobacteria bacterium]|nr:EamA family transporter [Alphaproteobacteria bacterium]